MLNNLQLEALNVVKNGDSIFLTGPPGVGKSYTLIEIVKYLQNSKYKIGITALTGCAAILIKGQTLHSFLGIGLGKESVEKLVEKIKKSRKRFTILDNLDTLIIDEISMMNKELFEKISEILSKIRKINKPFGGIRLILIGDFCQLSPISGDYCFKSKIWEKIGMKKIELKESVRQSGDLEFQKILEEFRIGRITSSTYKRLLTLEKTIFDNNIIPTKLYSLNNNVDEINKNNFKILYCKRNCLDLLNFDINSIKIINCYPAIDEELNKLISNINIIDNLDENGLEYIYKYNIHSTDKTINPDEYIVKLIKGSQVMITRNIDIDFGLVNGTRCIVEKLAKSYIIVSDIKKKFHRISYYNDDNINDCTYTKFLPIRLAYACSIHKSQGSTLDAIEIDGSKNIFAAGQLYTGLSRAKSLNNIKLVNLNKDAFIINNEVINFYS
jgi:ATP-dependent DNA helicase PIF1